MRIRRGPATVTGDACRLSHWGKPGKARPVCPEVRRPPSDHKHLSPRGKGSAPHASTSGPASPVFSSRSRAGAAASADVTVRAEGFGGTIVPETSVAATGAAVTKDGRQCAGNSAAGSPRPRRRGRLGRHRLRRGLRRQRRPHHARWTCRSRRRPTGTSTSTTCSQPIGMRATTPVTAAGDEILFYAACASASTACFTGSPLDVAAPAIVHGRACRSPSPSIQYDDTRIRRRRRRPARHRQRRRDSRRRRRPEPATTSVTFDHAAAP